MGGGSCPVTPAGGNRDSRAVHEREIVIAVRVAGQRDGQLGVALGVIPAPEPELDLGQECQRRPGKPDLQPGADPVHRQREILGRRPQVTGTQPGHATVGKSIGPGARHTRRRARQVAEQAERLAGVTAERKGKGPDAAGGVIPWLAAGAAAQCPV